MGAIARDQVEEDGVLDGAHGLLERVDRPFDGRTGNLGC